MIKANWKRKPYSFELSKEQNLNSRQQNIKNFDESRDIISEQI